MTILDGALITLVLILMAGVLAVIAGMLADEDGEGTPRAPWPRRGKGVVRSDHPQRRPTRRR